ncbi:MAG: GAF domain-containing protein [Solirubrobacterales bacterium]
MADGATFGSSAGRLGFGSPFWSGLVPALIALGGLAVLDAQAEWVITGFFAVVPFTTALSGDVRVTTAVAILAVIVSGASGFWNDNFDQAEFWLRFGLGVGASGFAVFIAYALDRSNRTARRLALLNEVSEGGGERPSLAATLDRITALAVPELADLCAIDVISGDRMERIAVRAAGPDREKVERYLMTRDQTVQVDAAFERTRDEGPIVQTHISDYDLRQLARDDDDLEMLRALRIRSFIVVALRSRGRRIGVLTLTQSISGRRQDEADAEFCQVLADRVALTLDNAGLFSDLESVEMRMDSVMSVLDEPVTITERSGGLIFANEAALELADGDSLDEVMSIDAGEADFDIYDEDGVQLGRGMFPWQVPGLERGQIVRMVHAGHGEETWLRIRSRPIPATDDRPIYTVTAFEDVTEMKCAEFAQSVVAATGELLATSTHPQETLARLVELLTPRLADSCAVLLAQGDGKLELAAAADVDPERQRLLAAAIRANPLHREAPGMPEMLASREPVSYDTADPAGWPEAAAPLAAGLEALGLGSVIGQPLRIGDRLIGIIGFANHVERRAFTPLERRIALRIAERVALAVDNSRIANERAEIAETLQNGSGPPRSRRSRAGRCRPSTTRPAPRTGPAATSTTCCGSRADGWP